MRPDATAPSTAALRPPSGSSILQLIPTKSESSLPSPSATAGSAFSVARELAAVVVDGLPPGGSRMERRASLRGMLPPAPQNGLSDGPGDNSESELMPPGARPGRRGSILDGLAEARKTGKGRVALMQLCAAHCPNMEGAHATER